MVGPAVAEKHQAPLHIQSSKLIEWLLSRKILKNDYPKRLSALHDQWKKLYQTLDVTSNDANIDVPYIHAQKTVDTLFKQDSTTDFFGRVNSELRGWKDLVSSYEKNNLHVAELSEAIHEIAAVSVPRCKSAISDRQKLITDLRQKIKEQTSNASVKEDLMSKAHKELNIEVPTNMVKLYLLELADQLPSQFDAYISELISLAQPLEIYHSMSSFVFRREDTNSPDLCRTLNLLIHEGHVRLYEWEHGTKPDRIMDSDDFVSKALTDERQKVLPPKDASLSENSAESPDNDTNVISWVDVENTELDFEIVESPRHSELVIELDGDNAQFKPEENTGAVAVGKSARLLLDTIEGRAALMNDLTELSAFLTRLMETYLELHGLENNEQNLVDPAILSTAKSFTGSTTIPSNLLQNAPTSVRSVSLKELAKMLADIERARCWLTDSSRNQLFLIRSKPGHLDRLLNRLTELHTQVERARGRVAEAQLRIQEAQTEQEQEASALLQYRADCRQLVTALEKELSRICNRSVQIVGQVLDL